MSGQPEPSVPSDLSARIDRLESLDQIRQLASKYAICLDMRDFDAMANLFVDDVGVPGKKKGRAALRQWYVKTMREIPGSFHGINGHIIDLDSADTGSGIVYSRNDLDLGEHWMHELMLYLDRYERRDGRWYFQRRTPLYWVHTDPNVAPLGPDKMRRPGSDVATRGAFHDAFPSWEEFWREHVDESSPVAPPAPLYGFIDTFRRGAAAPRVNPRGTLPPES